jgi:hypothetical protein
VAPKNLRRQNTFCRLKTFIPFISAFTVQQWHGLPMYRNILRKEQQMKKTTIPLHEIPKQYSGDIENV